MSDIARLAKRLTVTEFVRGEAAVMLDGDQIAVLHREPGFIWATTLGTPWGGGRKIATALQSVATAYLTLVENGRSMVPPSTIVHPVSIPAPLE